MWTLFEIAVNLFQATIMLSFLRSRLHNKKQYKRFAIFCVALTTSCMSMPLMNPSLYIPDILIFFIPYIFCLFTVKDRWFVTTFWTAVLILLFFLTITLSINIFTTLLDISYEEIMQSSMQRILFVLTTNAALAIVLLCVSRFRRKHSSLYWPVLMLFLFTIGSIFTVEESIFYLQKEVFDIHIPFKLPSFTWAYSGLLLCLIFVILLFHIMSQSIEREHRYQAEAAVTAQSQQYQEELSRLYQNLCHAKHDMKQHYEILHEMVNQGGNEQAATYLKQCKKALEQDDVFWTGSTPVDALLLSKMLTMKKNGIKFHFSPYPLQSLPVDVSVFCTILGNLLDNAIEGTLRLIKPEDPPCIQLTFSQSWDMFYIFCSNPCNESTIARVNGIWISSKSAEGISGFHSIGIHSIERMTNDAEGHCSFNVLNGYFHAKIVLPCITSGTRDSV